MSTPCVYRLRSNEHDVRLYCDRGSLLSNDHDSDKDFFVDSWQSGMDRDLHSLTVKGLTAITIICTHVSHLAPQCRTRACVAKLPWRGSDSRQTCVTRDGDWSMIFASLSLKRTTARGLSQKILLGPDFSCSSIIATTVSFQSE